MAWDGMYEVRKREDIPHADIQIYVGVTAACGIRGRGREGVHIRVRLIDHLGWGGMAIWRLPVTIEEEEDDTTEYDTTEETRREE